MLMIVIAITVSYLIGMVGTILLFTKVEKSDINNNVIIGFAVAFIALILVYEPFRNSIYAYFIILVHFSLALVYGLYVFQKVKKSATSSCEKYGYFRNNNPANNNVEE